MVLFLLKIIFLALSTLSNLVSRFVLTATAYLLVLAIHAFKVPGKAAKGAIEQVSDAVKSCAEYLLEVLLEAVSTAIYALFDLLKEGVSGSAVAAGSAIGGLVEKMRNSADGLLKDLPEVLKGFWEMVSTIGTDLWNNYKEAIGYVTENA
ncbi:hypothetical protein Acr_13g0008060 [Actinidia rufa]|uniref:Uncharacterized protein n=1 Tax=Actinidia rufa TaxID=165716 RepID=A0A7J0FL10_9ERIC|nr:hypothetical protein Acr_13g0008060 [Actinidia rufa]